jgi:hypothetical protein
MGISSGWPCSYFTNTALSTGISRRLRFDSSGGIGRSSPHARFQKERASQARPASLESEGWKTIILRYPLLFSHFTHLTPPAHLRARSYCPSRTCDNSLSVDTQPPSQRQLLPSWDTTSFNSFTERYCYRNLENKYRDAPLLYTNRASHLTTWRWPPHRQPA